MKVVRRFDVFVEKSARFLRVLVEHRSFTVSVYSTSLALGVFAGDLLFLILWVLWGFFFVFFCCLVGFSA